MEVHKGIKWLLDIFYSLQTTHYKLRLEIAGAGSLEGEVRKMAEAHPDKIAFHGKLTRDALMKKFQEVNALVVPSLCYENAPQIIAEAHSQGLPVIASRIGGIPEMIMEGKNGFLFTPGNAAELLSAIEKLPSLSVVPAIPMTAEQYVDLLVGLD
ncbi:MAG: glycosyltransferase [bacterium]|nr:glycosyltransferase [bacterium]